MTPFEDQVAKALSSAEDFVDGTGTVWVKRDEIAPRVAAAIEAAVSAVESGILETESEFATEIEQAALAALRGET